MFLGVSCGGEWWGLETFREVERLGYDGLFTGEHILFHRPVWDAVSMCTAIACATERIAVGAAAVIAPLRHPTVLAKELCGVDRISGGRLVVALGAGGDNPREFEAAGAPLARRQRRTTETHEILRHYFSGRPFTYRGQLYRLEDVRLDPPPARPGGPSLWVAGRRDAPRRRAAELGDGFLPYMVTPERCARDFAALRRDAEAAGRLLPPAFAFGAYLYLSAGEDGREARRRGDEHLAWRYDEPRFLGDLAGRYVISGTPPECAEGLARFREAGCTHLVLFLVRREGESPLEALRLVADGVLPSLRGT